MKPITERQAKILAAIVREYSNIGQPVGSEELTGKYGFNVSPATIRNEMVALEKLGYIEQPHTSAGRVPTDAGYRYFVNELMKHVELSHREQRSLKQQLQMLQQQHQELGKNIARLLAKETEQAAFALLPEEASAAGLANILQSQQTIDKNELVEVVQFFEHIDEYADRMLSRFFDEKSGALIGKEHSMPQISDYSLVVSKIKFPGGKSGLIGVIGPKSMRYDKNISLVEYVARFLSGGLLSILIIHARF